MLRQFEVAMQPRSRQDAFALSITGTNRLVCRVTVTGGYSRFGCGRDIPPGNYEVMVRQQSGNQGVVAVIAGERPVFVSGWQIWSRAYLGLLLLSAAWAAVARKSTNSQRRLAGIGAFQLLLLGFVAVGLYLLLHEGGHSLGEILFGRYDFGRSDFWGIHGTPHSGGRGGPPLASWQQAVISGAGPLLPSFGGWALFLFWKAKLGQNLRRARPLMDLYSCAIVALLVFPGFIVTPATLSGLIPGDGDWNGFINNVPGPLWLIKTLWWSTVIVSAFVLWRVVPGGWRATKAKFANRAPQHPLR